MGHPLKANARLIAAAPELLEAARECLNIMQYYHKSIEGHLDSCENPECCGHCKAANATRAAIAKAEGQT